MHYWRYSGIFLIGTGVIHNTIGIVAGWDMLAGVIADGLWDTIDISIPEGAAHTRAELLWFLLLGFAWMMIGALFHGNIKKQHTPPAKVWGWILVLKGLLVAVMLPASGAWLFLPQGMIIIFAKPMKK